MLPPKLRFAQTLLSYKNRHLAIDDEMMIDKTNGNLYYKKPDGTIISCSGSTYAENISAFESIYSLGLSREDVWVGRSNKGLYIVSETTFPEPQEAMVKYTFNDESFIIDTHSQYMFLCLKTRDEDKHYAALLTALRNANMSIPDETNVKVDLIFDIMGQVGTDVDGETPIMGAVRSVNFTASVTMNKMSEIKFPYDTIWKMDAYKAYEIKYDNEHPDAESRADEPKLTMTQFVVLEDTTIGEKSGLEKGPYMERFREDHPYAEVKVVSLTPTIEYSNNLHELRESDLFDALVPSDEHIEYFKYTVAYFTHSYETVYLDTYDTVITVMDVHSSLQAFESGDIRGYIDYSILPIIRRLYNAGLNNSKQYVLDFVKRDWEYLESVGIYRIAVPFTQHKLTKEIISDIYYLSGGLYRTHFGVWDEINYKMSMTADNDIIITTEDPFDGRLICRNFSAMGTTEEDWADIPTTGFGSYGAGYGSCDCAIPVSDIDIENMFTSNTEKLYELEGEVTSEDAIEEMFKLNSFDLSDGEVDLTPDDETDVLVLDMFDDNEGVEAEHPEADGIIDDIEAMFIENSDSLDDE